MRDRNYLFMTFKIFYIKKKNLSLKKVKEEKNYTLEQINGIIEGILNKVDSAPIIKRIAPKEPLNDGKQTPMKGHPVFIAQHATATCCRECTRKWHKM